MSPQGNLDVTPRSPRPRRQRRPSHRKSLMPNDPPRGPGRKSRPPDARPPRRRGMPYRGFCSFCQARRQAAGADGRWRPAGTPVIRPKPRCRKSPVPPPTSWPDLFRPSLLETHAGGKGIGAARLPRTPARSRWRRLAAVLRGGAHVRSGAGAREALWEAAGAVAVPGACRTRSPAEKFRKKFRRARGGSDLFVLSLLDPRRQRLDYFRANE